MSSRTSFTLRPSGRWAIAYLIASYAVSLEFLAWEYFAHPGFSPYELLVPVTMPLLMPFMVIWSLPAFASGVRAALLPSSAFLTFLLVFGSSAILLRRQQKKVA